MMGTCSIPTGQISTQAMHCVQAQTVSARMGSPIRSARSSKRGGTPSAARSPIAPSATSRRSRMRSRGESG